MNRPDSNDPWPVDPKAGPSGDALVAFERRLRATRPRPARFGTEELVNAIPLEIPASRSPPVPGDQKVSTRHWWWAIAASWIGGMVLGASSLQILRESDVPVEKVSDVIPSADSRASESGWVTTLPAADLDRNRSSDVDHDPEGHPWGRFIAVGPYADAIPAWDGPVYWADIVKADSPLRAWSVRQTGPMKRHSATTRPEMLMADTRPAHSANAETVGPTAPPTPTSSGMRTEERPPLTPASYRGQLRHLLEPPADERL
jgi:hypothetical protein